MNKTSVIVSYPLCLFAAILLWLGLPFTSLAQAEMALEEITDFGSNPGNLRMFIGMPDELPEGVPLVVALHGCTQTAAAFDNETGWAKYAALWRFALLLPEQRRINNGQRCFNWFRHTDATRDQGEALSIRQMIAALQTLHAINPERIYITGLSAGGAMTSVMLATYPEVFAGGAIMAGVPYGCASGMLSGFWCMLWGRDLDAAEWEAKV
ncbi:MAG: PHB depolymerase family esterase, partial [Candidatus Competibacteraceae bacterium]|nr:PHB depolymerase family esterase [Candidatus Competibacteraceae bacterium]